MKQRVKTIPIDLYKRGVQVFYGTDKQFRSYAKREGFEVDWAEYEAYGDKTGGMTIRLPLDVVIVLFESASEGVVVHELGHAAKHILRIVEVEDEEAEMYLLEYLYNEVMPWYRSIQNEKKL